MTASNAKQADILPYPVHRIASQPRREAMLLSQAAAARLPAILVATPQRRVPPRRRLARPARSRCRFHRQAPALSRPALSRLVRRMDTRPHLEADSASSRVHADTSAPRVILRLAPQEATKTRRGKAAASAALRDSTARSAVRWTAPAACNARLPRTPLDLHLLGPVRSAPPARRLRLEPPAPPRLMPAPRFQLRLALPPGTRTR